MADSRVQFEQCSAYRVSSCTELTRMVCAILLVMQYIIMTACAIHVSALIHIAKKASRAYNRRCIPHNAENAIALLHTINSYTESTYCERRSPALPPLLPALPSTSAGKRERVTFTVAPHNGCSCLRSATGTACSVVNCTRAVPFGRPVTLSRTTRMPATAPQCAKKAAKSCTARNKEPVST
jgi:hypothetical protein